MSEQAIDAALEAERAVLSAMLLDPAATPRAAAILTPESFYRAGHGKVFAAILALHSRGLPADVLMVVDELRRSGEIAAAGGPEGVAALFAGATSGANVEHHARLVRHAAATRERVRIGREIAGEASGDRAAVRDLVARLEQLDAAESDSGGLIASARWDESFSSADLVRPAPLLGDGLISAGDLAVLAGAPGLGKSRLALELGIALSTGERWLGLPTSLDPARVGYVAAEFTTYRWVERVVQVMTGRRYTEACNLWDAYRELPVAGPGGLFKGIPGDRLDQPLNLLESAAADQLIAMIETLALNVCILDPVFRMMNGQDETNEFFGQAVATLDRVRFKTGCAIILVHHVRKSQPGGRESADPLDMIRGGSKLRDAVNTALFLTRTEGGLHRLEFAKANYARLPEPIFHRIPDDGGRTLVEDSPIERREGNLGRLLAWCEAQAEPFSAGAAQVGVGEMTLRTVQRHLASIAASGALEQATGPHNMTLWRFVPVKERDRTTRPESKPVADSQLLEGF